MLLLQRDSSPFAAVDILSESTTFIVSCPPSFSFHVSLSLTEGWDIITVIPLLNIENSRGNGITISKLVNICLKKEKTWLYHTRRIFKAQEYDCHMMFQLLLLNTWSQFNACS